MRIRDLSIKTKLLIVGVGCVITQAIVTIVLAVVMGGQTNASAVELVNELLDKSMADIVHSVHSLAETQDATLRREVDAGVNVSKRMLVDKGGLQHGFTSTEWTATDQFTKEKKKVSLPAPFVGSTPLPITDDPEVPVPIVDEVAQMVGGTCTIFMRMNDAGDMLRVATNVINDKGQRAIGTYIPAKGKDGKPNAVVSTLLGKERFSGRAFVVNQWYLTAYDPLLDASGEVIGAVYYGVAQNGVEELHKSIHKIKVGNDGYVFVIGGHGRDRGRYLVSKNGTRDGDMIWEAKDADGNLFIQDMVTKAVKLKPGETTVVHYPWQNEGEAEARQKVSYVTYYEPWDWVIGAGTYESDFEAARNVLEDGLDSLVLTFLIVSAILVGLGAFGFFVFSSSIAKRIRRFLNAFVKMTEGDLRERIPDDAEDELGQMAGQFGEMVGGLSDLVGSLADSSGNVATAAREIAAGSEGLARRSQEQAAALEETSATVEEMTSSVRHNADNASRADDLVKQAVGLADDGSAIVQKTTTAMSEVTASAKKIAEIVDMVDEIAFQTNLLALNAAVEAARAGDMGRGFAVVASAVRSLAGRSAAAAKQIHTLIQDSNSRIAETNDYVDDSGKTLEKIIGSVREVADMVGEIAAASREQAAGIEQVNRAVSQMDQATQENAALIEEASAAANNLAMEADGLRQLAHRFDID